MCFFECAKMCDEIPITHIELGFEFLKDPFLPSGEERHDGEATFLMDSFVEF